MPDPVVDLLPRQSVTPGGAPCGQNNATNRACWKNSWNISTDYEVSYPPAFNTRVIDLYITNVSSWTGPDGVVKKHVMLINNTFPGPTITADWGDYIQVNVHNKLQDNGTSIHWHGIRQYGESDQDGANGVTECPIPPGSSKYYAFHVTQYGSSWYHSHYSSQYGNGVVGALVVNGPASANYDIDLGPYVITDYYYDTADNLQRTAELVSGGPPPSDNVLIRGKNINPSGSGGAYDRITLTPGKKHLLRIINTSVDNSFTVSLVGHVFTVIANDLVPVTPVNRTQLFVGVGQRYDVIVSANQKTDNYWFNVTLETNGNCGTSKNKYPAAVFHYDGAGTGNPTNKGSAITAGCTGETGFSPIVKRTVSSSLFQPKDISINLTTPTVDFRGQVFRWLVDNVALSVQWDHPILEYVANGSNAWPAEANVVEVPDKNVWTFWIIQNNFFLPHPLHLHGHDFLILGSDTGTFNAATMTSQLNFNNPVRRDVAQLPGSGWLVIAFYTDNPGCWLMHCHIAWHVSQGLSIQFLERKSEIASLMHLNQMQPNCQAWRAYAPTSPWLPKLDSGL